MEKLLRAVASRFDEVFEVTATHPELLTKAISETASDFDLSKLVASHPKLQNDKQLAALVIQVQRYTDPDFESVGQLKTDLHRFGAGLLKGLLQDSLIPAEVSRWRAHVEKIASWYQGVRNVIEDASFEEQEPAAITPVPPPEEELAASRVSFPPEVTKEKVKFTRPDFVTPQLNLRMDDEQNRKKGIQKKLQLYKKRNLRESHELRCSGAAAAPRPPQEAARSHFVRSLKPTPVGLPRKGGGAGGVKIVYKDKSRPSTKGAEVSAAPVFMHGLGISKPEQQEFRSTMERVQEIWVNARAKEIEERFEEQEFKDTLSLWSHNQSRVEEELNRRMEASQMSSQTGRSCHKIVKRPRSSESERFGDVFGAMSLLEDLSGEKAPLPGVDGLSTISTKEDDTKFCYGKKPAPHSISLSPYDHYVPSRDGRKMKLFSTIGPIEISNPDSDVQKDMKGKGLKHTHPWSLRGTSFFNQSLDVVSSPKTVIAPSMMHGLEKIKGPAPGPTLLDQIFPILSVEQDVPSLTRMQQIQEVEAIRECFARHGVSVPTSVIEDGIFTPEDRPYLECVTNLPPPEMGLCRDFISKGGGGTGGKKGKGKGKGKKKK